VPPTVDLAARAERPQRDAPSAAPDPLREPAPRRGAGSFVVVLIAALLLLPASGPSVFATGQSLLAPVFVLAAFAAFAAYGLAIRARSAHAAKAGEADGAGPRERRRATDGAHTHRRVRIALHGVLLVVGAQAALHAWFAESAERARAQDARLAELAARQRMISQRIGRLASTLPSGDGALVQGLRELDAMLERAELDARRLEEMVRDKRLLLQPDTPQLNAAWAAWIAAHDNLLTAARALVRHGEGVDPWLRQGFIASVQAQADPALDAAQRFLDSLSTLLRERELAAVSQARLHSVLTLVVLLVLAVFVAEPAARRVQRQYALLAERMQDLQRLALVAERTTNVVVLTDESRRIFWVNDAFRRVTGREAGQVIGRTPEELLFEPDVNGPALERLREAIGRGEGTRLQLQSRALDGSERWLEIDVQPLRDASGRLTGFVDVASDVTERRRAQADLRVAAIAFDSLEAIAITDANRAILRVNRAFTRITGYEPHEAIGRTPGSLLRSGRQDRAFYDAMEAALERDRHWQGELWNRRKNGELYPEWLSITAVTDDEGRVEHYVAVFTDITQKRKADETIHRLAYYDPLTELPNRRLLRERLLQTLQSSARTRRHAAVLFIDLDRFKLLNDTRGHDVGDLLLVEVARRLRTCELIDSPKR